MSVGAGVKTDEKRLRDLLAALDAASDGVALASPDLKLEYANRALCDMAECERPEEMIGREVADFVTAETFAVIRARAMAGELADRAPFVEGVLRGVRGRLVPVEYGASVLRDEEGKPYGFLAIIRDMTARQRTEEALRASEAHHRTLLETLPQKIFCKDRNSVYLYCNSNYARDLGIATHEIVGRTDYDFHPEDLADKYRSDDQRVMESGQTEELEERYSQGGREYIVHTIKTPLKDEAGNVVGVLGVFSDITARKRTEAELQESVGQLQAIYDGIADGLVVAELDTGRIVRVNSAACAMLGYSEEEFLEKRVADLHPADSLTEVMAEFQAQASGEKVVAPGLPCRRKDDSIFFADITSRPIIYKGQRNLVGFFRDITERKRTEAALTNSEEKFRALVESTSDWIWEVDEGGRYTYASPRVRDILGYTPEEVIGKTPFDLMLPDEAKRIADVFGRLAADQRPLTSLVNRNIHKEGHEVILETSAIPVFDARGSFKGYRGIDRDITERKRAERELEAKNQELESFVYTVSHDLRAPLVSLEGFARLLAEEYGERLDAEGQDYLRRLRTNVGVMNSLLTDLLELSRVGRRQEPAQAVAVSEVAAEARESLAELVGRSGAKLEVAADLPMVWYSRLALSQVFVNLISNAIKFSREGEIPRVEIGWEKRPGGCRFHVTDNGIGIPTEHRQRVFEIFGRLKQKPVEGTGIGLAIVKRIVESNRGEVGVDSRPGEGSTFWFTVPDRAEGS